MTLFHGTKHPYCSGDALISGGIVAPCSRSEDGEPIPGCSCGCDGRRMVWATTDFAEALHAAKNRACTCGETRLEHRPRIFEVILDAPEEDPNTYTVNSVMALSGRVVSEIDISSP